jgi:hypothetical protein
MRLSMCLLAAAVVGVIFASKAAAAYDPVAAGSTALKLSPSFARLLHRSEIELEGKGGVTVHGRTIVFPLSEGTLEPVEAKGTMEHAGQLVFIAGGRELPLRSLQLKTTRPSSPFSAKVGGGQLKLTSAAGLASERLGFGSSFETTDMRLSVKVASRLERKLRLRGVFEGGQLLGSAKTTVEPATVVLSAMGAVDVTLDPTFSATLAEFFVAINPVFPAEHPGPFSFPITGGNLAPNGLSGILKTAGGVELIQLGGGQLTLRNLALEIGTTVAAEYQLVLASSGAAPNVLGPAFGLGAGGLSGDAEARVITEQGATLTLSRAVAQAFNEAFARPLGRPDRFMEGEVFGTVALTATGE